ncbi:hypothetical protein MKX03_023236 [Papaver bracteatum]|nr:hypothetical protein MKX03_023236 [Papaver bracteatum]
MRSGRDEEKSVGPFVSRLHVYDTAKGGPRATPRNKMVLYKYLSIPSQRFNSGLCSTLFLPPSKLVIQFLLPQQVNHVPGPVLEKS